MKAARQQAVIGYTRVSSEGQAQEGVSLEAQAAQIRAYATMKGFELLGIVEDAGISGGVALADRQGGSEVLAAIKGKKVSGVVACKLDRLFRDASDCLATTSQWDKSGVALHLLDMGGQSIDTSSAMGRMFLTMMAGMAEMERNLTSERTKAALSHKKAKGERVGTVAYGFQLSADGVNLEPNQAEQAVIECIKTLADAGLSQRAIVAELEKRGVLGRTGKPLQKTQIARILEAA